MKRANTFMLFAAVPLLLAGLALPATADEFEDAVDAALFDPELIMQYQGEIGLSKEQSIAIRDTLKAHTEAMTGIQWDLVPMLQELTKALEPAKVDEARVRKLLRDILEQEAKAKEEQLVAMVRIKNTLTPQQQAKLRELKK
ncbi:hypothetical protein ABI59_08760 [Acidobacteria bacterium Mor1]|nr:hypothetical protein ABI59_08760 [Acidobacteria bacterium Mor1]